MIKYILVSAKCTISRIYQVCNDTNQGQPCDISFHMHNKTVCGTGFSASVAALFAIVNSFETVCQSKAAAAMVTNLPFLLYHESHGSFLIFTTALPNLDLGHCKGLLDTCMLLRLVWSKSNDIL